MSRLTKNQSCFCQVEFTEKNCVSVITYDIVLNIHTSFSRLRTCDSWKFVRKCLEGYKNVSSRKCSLTRNYWRDFSKNQHTNLTKYILILFENLTYVYCVNSQKQASGSGRRVCTNDFMLKNKHIFRYAACV